MTGSFRVEVKNSEIAYKFELHRNITVLRGDGATGKSLLCWLVNENTEHPGQGITVNVTRGAKIQVLTRARFEDGVLNSDRGDIIFVVDEDTSFIGTSEFATAVNNSGYYFLLITRDKLAQLSCSIKEVYELIHLTERYTEFKRLYPNTHYGRCDMSRRKVLTEDTGAGRQFFSRLLTKDSVRGAGGRDNVENLLSSGEYSDRIVIADGAAFGFNIEKILPLLNLFNAYLIVEESFEYVILKSGAVHNRLPKDIDLDAPEVESAEFNSWERYYEDLLVQISENMHTTYKKEHLPQEFSNKKNIENILAVYQLQYLAKSGAQYTNLFGGDSDA